MFVVEVVAALTTILFIRDLVTGGGALGFAFQINLWLWFTVLFANFAEAVAEGRGKAQAATLRKTKTETHGQAARRPARPDGGRSPATDAEAGRSRAGRGRRPDPERRRGDRGHRLGQRGGDHRRVARRSSARAAATARRSPAARRCSPTGSRCASPPAPGSTFLDRMIALVEGARAAEDAERDRAEHPARRPDDHLRLRRRDHPELRDLCRRAALGVLVLVALFVTLIPTTIGALLSAIGIAGMDRLVRFNVLAMSGRAVEAAGDVDTLLLDKTGTITLGNRQATEFLPLPGVDASASWPMRRSSPRCPTRRRKAARSSCWPRRSTASAAARWRRCNAHFIPFTAQTRISGIDLEGSSIRKGAVDAVLAHVRSARRRQWRAAGAVSRWPRPPMRACATSPRSPSDRQVGRHAARRRQGRPLARRHPSEGHRQGRHPRALRRAAPHGHPHGDDHRRQPADRRGHRRRGGRRRLPRPGDAGGQARS